MLKKYILGVLLAAGFSATAIAQDSCCVDRTLFGGKDDRTNVQIYGRVDVGVITANSVQNSAGQTVGITQVSSSPMYTSNLGFIGRRALATDTVVYARLEGQVNPADGSSGTSSSSGSANSQFAREANLGIVSQKFGTMIIGRQINPVYQAWSQTDVRGPFAFGSSLLYQSDGSSFGGTATAKTGISNYTGGSYISNAISYITPTYAGFRGTLLYGAGNTAGEVDYSQKQALSRVYDNQGLFTGTTGYYNSRNSTGGITGRYWWVGGGVRPTAASQVRIGYTVFENPMTKGILAANSQWALTALSGQYQFTKEIKAWLGYYMMNDKINSANQNRMKSIGTEYAFDQYTQVYTALSLVNNNGTAGWAGYGGGGANYSSLNTNAFSSSIGQGKSQTAMTVGIVHRF